MHKRGGLTCETWRCARPLSSHSTSLTGIHSSRESSVCSLGTIHSSPHPSFPLGHLLSFLLLSAVATPSSATALARSLLGLMQKNSKTFVMDTRNVGGRQVSDTTRPRQEVQRGWG